MCRICCLFHMGGFAGALVMSNFPCMSAKKQQGPRVELCLEIWIAADRNNSLLLLLEYQLTYIKQIFHPWKQKIKTKKHNCTEIKVQDCAYMNGDYKDGLDYAILSFPGSELQNRRKPNANQILSKNLPADLRLQSNSQRSSTKQLISLAELGVWCCFNP